MNGENYMLNEKELRQAINSARAATGETGKRHSVVLYRGDMDYEVVPTVEAVKLQAKGELRVIQDVVN